MKASKVSEARKSPTFRELERQAEEAQDKLDSIMRVLEKDFPLEDGYWVLMANGKFSVCYTDDY